MNTRRNVQLSLDMPAPKRPYDKIAASLKLEEDLGQTAYSPLVRKGQRTVRFPAMGKEMVLLPPLDNLRGSKGGKSGSVTERLIRLSKPNSRAPPHRPPTVGGARLPGVNNR